MKKNIIWPGTDLDKKIHNHISILYYEDAVDYYIKEIREKSEAPIVICHPNPDSAGIKKLSSKYDYVYHYVGNPKIAYILKANVENAQHVLILSPSSSIIENLDMDAIILANFIEEWYPQVTYQVMLKNQKSVKLVESSIIQNNNIDFTHLYSSSFMTGKIFYQTGSLFINNPTSLKFLNDIIDDNSKLMTIKANNSYFINRRYGDVFNDLLYESPIKILLLGVFASTNEINQSIEKFLKQLLEDSHGKLMNVSFLRILLYR